MTLNRIILLLCIFFLTAFSGLKAGSAPEILPMGGIAHISQRADAGAIPQADPAAMTRSVSLNENTSNPGRIHHYTWKIHGSAKAIQQKLKPRKVKKTREFSIGAMKFGLMSLGSFLLYLIGYFAFELLFISLPYIVVFLTAFFLIASLVLGIIGIIFDEKKALAVLGTILSGLVVLLFTYILVILIFS